MRLFITILFCILTATSVESSAETIRLGVADYVENGIHRDLIHDSVEKIRKTLEPKHSLKVIHLSEKEMKVAIEQHELDLFVASSSFYRRMIRKGARDLVSVQTGKDSGPNKAEGATVLVDGRRDDLTSFKDLAGKAVSFSRHNSLFTSLMIERELRDRGLPPLVFVNGGDKGEENLPSLLEKLKSNLVDAVITPACTLERMAEESDIDTSWLRVLEPRQFSSLKCAHSSLLYPGLTVASLPSLNSVFSKGITQELLDTSSSDGEHFWAVPTDFSEVDQLLRSLDLDAWADERKWTIEKVIREYWPLVTAFLVVLLCLATYSSVVSVVVNKRTKSLRLALKREQALKRQSLEASRRIEQMQRIGAFSQLTSLFAHELGQPIYAIRCFCYSLQKALQRLKKEEPELTELISDIEEQAIRADEIVSKTRSYIKGRKGCLEKVEICHIAEKAIQTFKMVQYEDLQIFIDCSVDKIYVFAEPLDIELILINLFRNCVDACGNLCQARIWIAINKVGEFVEIKVWDSGPAISPKVLSDIREQRTSSTSKEKGLGIGLKIVESLTEVLGGRVTFDLSQRGGLEVTLKFPLFEV